MKLRLSCLMRRPVLSRVDHTRHGVARPRKVCPNSAQQLQYLRIAGPWEIEASPIDRRGMSSI